MTSPPTYEFAGPPNETYPIWYDISRYYEGMRVSIRPREMARRLATDSLTVFKLLFGLHGAIGASLFILAAISVSCFGLARFGRWFDLWFVLLPCAAGLAMYAAVHTEPRYCAQFIAPAILAVLATIPLPAEAPYRRVVLAMGAAMLVFFLIPGGPLGQARGYSAMVGAAAGTRRGTGQRIQPCRGRAAGRGSAAG